MLFYPSEESPSQSRLVPQDETRRLTCFNVLLRRVTNRPSVHDPTGRAAHGQCARRRSVAGGNAQGMPQAKHALQRQRNTAPQNRTRQCARVAAVGQQKVRRAHVALLYAQGSRRMYEFSRRIIRSMEAGAREVELTGVDMAA